MQLLRNRCFLTGIIVIFLCIYSTPGFGYWIWTRESGKWVNPKYDIKETAKEQFNWAEDFLKKGDYKRAIDEYKKIFKKFPENPFAARAHLAIGMCYYRMNKFNQAFESYQKVINEYPSSNVVQIALELEEKLAQGFLEKKSAGQFLTPQHTRYNKAAEIYQQIVDNFPFQSRAAELQYKVGLIYYQAKNYKEAIKAFEKVKKKYSESPWAEESSFMIGVVYWDQTPPSLEYHQDIINKAIESFQIFIKNYPGHPKVKEAKQYLSNLIERQAELLFNIGEFYYKQEGSLKAASIYYRKLEENFSETHWGKEARKRLAEIEEIERRIKKEGTK